MSTVARRRRLSASRLSSSKRALLESRAPVGLIGHNHSGVGDERASRGNALLLTAGHLVGILVEHLTDRQTRGYILHAGRNFGRVCAGDGERQGNVLACRERIEQVGVLEDKAELLAAELRKLGLFHARHVLAVDADGAARGGIDGRHAVEQRDLPEPEAPMIPTNSPRLTVKLTSLSARVTLPSAPYTFSRCATSSTGVAACMVCIPSPFLRLVYGIYSRKKPSRLPSIWLTLALPLRKVSVVCDVVHVERGLLLKTVHVAAGIIRKEVLTSYWLCSAAMATCRDLGSSPVAAQSRRDARRRRAPRTYGRATGKGHQPT